MQRLPPGLRVTATKKMEEDDWSMDRPLTFIQREVETRERANLPGSPATKTGMQRNKPAAAAALLSGYYDNTCSYCQGKQLSANCKMVTNVIARKDILERS